ncbi:magnesium transporter, partial [Escherichia coli]|uniref:magnesium transporter n=1 Tax=Escherichia coli TaxID=562 RepID=UPI0034D4EB2F
MGTIAAVIFTWSQRTFISELFFNILIVVVSTMALSLLVISPIGLTASFISFKHGLDPDIVLYPVESTISDFLITLLYVGVLNVFLFN